MGYSLRRTGCLAVASSNRALNRVALSLSATHQPTTLRLKMSRMTTRALGTSDSPRPAAPALRSAGRSAPRPLLPSAREMPARGPECRSSSGRPPRPAGWHRHQPGLSLGRSATAPDPDAASGTALQTRSGKSTKKIRAAKRKAAAKPPRKKVKVAHTTSRAKRRVTEPATQQSIARGAPNDLQVAPQTYQDLHTAPSETSTAPSETTSVR